MRKYIMIKINLNTIELGPCYTTTFLNDFFVSWLCFGSSKKKNPKQSDVEDKEVLRSFTKIKVTIPMCSKLYVK